MLLRDTATPPLYEYYILSSLRENGGGQVATRLYDEQHVNRTSPNDENIIKAMSAPRRCATRIRREEAYTCAF